MSQSRQLAAIMFTDIVGYTSLMGNDEQKAFIILNKNRALQKPIIEQFNGRWIKELGDGVMTSFNTVADAVYAAVKIQEACNASKEFQLRIGIHLGDVLFENDDVFGDGVNIASRIQAIAKPGSIYVSESVHNNISNKKDITTKFIKEETLKNVKEAVRIYEVNADNFAMDQFKPDEFKKEKGTSLLKISIIIIIIFALVLGIWGVVNKHPKPDKKDRANATSPFKNDVDSNSKKLSSQIDSGFTNRSKKSTFPEIKKYSSLLEVAATDDGNNPVFLPTDKPDSFNLKILISNTGEGTAYNLTDVETMVTESGNSFSISPFKKYPSTFNQYSKIYKNEAIPIYSFISFHGAPRDKQFYCFKLTYSDDVHEKDSLIAIYSISYPVRVNEGLLLANSFYFSTINKYLMDKKFW